MNNFYIILGIHKNATQEEIKRAYRQRVKEFHPDHYSGDTGPFLAVQQAYKTLGDPVKRRHYDRELYKKSHHRPHSAPVVPTDVVQDVSTGFSVTPLFPDFESLFERMWNSFSGGYQQAKSLQIEIPVSRRMAERGGLFRINVPIEMTCPDCYGRGTIRFYDCPTCGGIGTFKNTYPLSISLPPGMSNHYSVRVPLERAGVTEVELWIEFRIVDNG